MGTHRILAALALVLASGLSAPRDAAACQTSGLYLGTGPQLPLGCPLHVYAAPDAFERNPPTITVLRGGSYVNATGTTTQDLVQVVVEQTFESCPPGTSNTTRTSETFPHFAVVPLGVSVGEAIGVGSTWLAGIKIVAAGACAAPVLPMPSCTDARPCFFEPQFDDVQSQGCAVGHGGPGWLMLLGVAVLVRWAPRRRPRR